MPLDQANLRELPWVTVRIYYTCKSCHPGKDQHPAFCPYCGVELKAVGIEEVAEKPSWLRRVLTTVKNKIGGAS